VRPEQAGPATRDDGELARWLAGQVGAALVGLRERHGHADPAALGRAGDAHAQALIADALARWRPHDAVLSEEAPDDPVRLSAARVWIVDPLDGTREFTEPGRTDWAVHIALWSRGAGLTAGAVALPAQHRVLATDRPPAYPRRRATVPGPLLTVSRSRPPAWAAAVAEGIGATLVPIGSAGAKAAAVITGEVDGYLHASGHSEWDSAAPVAVAAAAGLHTSRLDGSALAYNQPEPRTPDLLLCRRELAPRLLAAVAAMRRP
jgi:3'(2'), 5'-bisphosphate nucleotidase